MKALWRCLLNNLDCQIENVLTVIIACCVLHSICQLNKNDYVDNDGIFEAVIRQEPNARRRRRNNRAPVNAINTREAIYEQAVYEQLLVLHHDKVKSLQH